MKSLVAMTYEAEKRREKVNRAWMERGRDEVLPQHQEIHVDLLRWGRWNRERYEPATCASIEKLYEKGGSEATPPATAPTEVHPRTMQIERAMPLMLPDQRGTLKMYYVKRFNLGTICHRYRIRYEGFSRWMELSRDALVHILACSTNLKEGVTK